MRHSSVRALVNDSRPEWKLLLGCARTARDDAHSARIRDLAGGDIDWDHIVRLASLHHVLPLLYQSLSTICPDAVPVATMDELAREFSGNVARNLALTFELIKILKWFEAHEIAAIPFKGPTLASLAYGGLALRQAGDLDIFVPERDVRRARDLLLSRNFRPYHELTEEEEFGRHYHFLLVRDEDSTAVELHWGLTFDYLCFDLDQEALWQSKASYRLAGVTVPGIPTSDLLLFLCAHGAKHCWERLSWICDIAELIRVDRGIDWELVMHKARKLGGERILCLGLILASDLLEAPLDPVIARRVGAEKTARNLAREVVERCFREMNVSPSFAEILRFNTRVRERRRDRLRCRLKLAAPALKPTPEDFAFLPLSPRLSFLYAGIKPLRLAIGFASNPSGFLRKFGEMIGL